MKPYTVDEAKKLKACETCAKHGFDPQKVLVTAEENSALEKHIDDLLVQMDELEVKHARKVEFLRQLLQNNAKSSNP